MSNFLGEDGCEVDSLGSSETFVGDRGLLWTGNAATCSWILLGDVETLLGTSSGLGSNDFLEALPKEMGNGLGPVGASCPILEESANGVLGGFGVEIGDWAGGGESRVGFSFGSIEPAGATEVVAAEVGAFLFGPRARPLVICVNFGVEPDPVSSAPDEVIGRELDIDVLPVEDAGAAPGGPLASRPARAGLNRFAKAFPPGFTWNLPGVIASF